MSNQTKHSKLEDEVMKDAYQNNKNLPEQNNNITTNNNSMTSSDSSDDCDIDIDDFQTTTEDKNDSMTLTSSSNKHSQIQQQNVKENKVLGKRVKKNSKKQQDDDKTIKELLMNKTASSQTSSTFQNSSSKLNTSSSNSNTNTCIDNSQTSNSNKQSKGSKRSNIQQSLEFPVNIENPTENISIANYCQNFNSSQSKRLEYEEDDSMTIQQYIQNNQQYLNNHNLQSNSSEDPEIIKTRLMHLVSKGQQEADLEHQKTIMNTLHKAKDDQEMYEKSFLQEAQNTVNTQMERPAVRNINCQSEDFMFMCLDVDFYIDKPLSTLKNCDPNTESTIIRLYGVNSEGNSLLVHVHNFKPYFFIQLSYNQYIDQSHLPELKRFLNSKLPNSQGVVDIELMERQSIQNYTDKNQKFVKVYTILPKYVNTLRSFVEKGLQFNGVSFWTTTYESNLPHALRFMIDNQVVGMSWIRIEKGTYSLRKSNQFKSVCQIELDVTNCKTMKCFKQCEGEYGRIAPLRILSFDIECSAEKGKFPSHERDPIIQIANICQINGEAEPFIRNVFTLKSCAPIVGTRVFSFSKESDLLYAWREFVRVLDPDILTGYNIVNFDLPYIIGRAEALKLAEYPKFSRIKDTFTKVRDSTFSSKSLGTRETKDINIDGRIQFDMLQYIIREYKLRSYSLNSVSAKFLGEQKEDVQHTIISELQNKNEFTRRRLAIYCIKDAYLPLRLMWKLECLFHMTEISRVCGVPLSYLFTRGQQIKVASQLYRKSQELGYLIPTDKSNIQDGKYEGAVVIEPIRGFYQEPVAILDFASLYPSIMMAHNLCYSTLVPPYKLKDVDVSMYEKTPNGDYFVKKSVKKGVLPIILEELIQARKRVKVELARTTDPYEIRLLDSRQNALKTSANSVYGFTGAQVGQLPCLPISCSVTAYGRMMLDRTKSLIKDKFCTRNGYQYDSEVIYGDTDSVMIKFGTSTIEETMVLGKEAAEYVTSFFDDPIKLEFEKIYCPYLLMNKKRYAGLLWTSPQKYDKIDAKGIETVRRDNCPLVKDVVNTVLKKILMERSYEDAINYCKGVISDLLQNRIDLSLLVITRGLGKKAKKVNSSDDKDTYQAKQAHVELAEKMRKRDEASAPSVGDRIAFVMVKGTKDAKGYEKSEDPLYVLENNLPIDYQHYLQHQLKQPLIRIFEPILQNPEYVLLTGEHTRSIHVPKVTNTGLGRYTIVKKSCLRCKSVVESGALCKDCMPEMKKIYIERKLEQITYEKNYNDLWVQCQRCQGSLHLDILCQSRDCPIFYRRVKALKNLKESRDIIERFPQW